MQRLIKASIGVTYENSYHVVGHFEEQAKDTLAWGANV